MATEDRALAPLTKLWEPDPEEFEEGHDAKEMTLLEHLDELRKRIMYSAIAIAITTVISLVFAQQIFEILLDPARRMMPGFYPIYTELTEYLGVFFRVGLFSGLVLAMPVLVYQLIRFIAPALTRTEKRYLLFSLPPLFVSFLLGVTFGYFVLLPPALNFLLHFGTEVARPEIKIASYVGTVTTLLFWIGLSFETPFIMFVLGKLKLVTPEKFAGFRRYFVVVAFVLAAFITPTFDPINQTLVAVPMIILFEVGIWLSRIASKM